MRGESGFTGTPSDRQVRFRPRYMCVPYPVDLARMELRHRLPPAQIRILMLRRFADPVTGEWETTTEEIARMTRLSRSAVQKALSALERARWIHARHVRTRTFRLIICFGGFADPPYLKEGKSPLVWDNGFPGSERRAQPTSLGTVSHISDTGLLLKLTHSHLLTTLNKRVLHLRVNIILPVGNARLRVMHGYNMDHDRDRDLELGIDSGAAGRCWQTGKPIVCDLEKARKTFATRWRMSEDQQARVRPSLQSLLSVPILEPMAEQNTPEEDVLPLGVLSFDSDEDLRRDFHGSLVQEAAAECATVAGTWLSGKPRQL